MPRLTTKREELQQKTQQVARIFHKLNYTLRDIAIIVNKSPEWVRKAIKLETKKVVSNKGK